MTADELLVELAAWNAAQEHARRAYQSAGAVSAPVKPTCWCGRRTQHPTGVCASCRATIERNQMSTSTINEGRSVDLPDDQAAVAEELRALDGAPLAFTGPVDVARVSGYGSDYQWVTWLADVLRDAGCPVVEHPGWKTRGRPRTSGPFVPKAVMIHHDASAAGPSPGVAAFIVAGRPAEGIPGPLSQVWVCMGCNGAHPVGTWHVLAAGRCNHAGEGDGWGPISRDDGNTDAIGVETDNTTGEPTPAAMLSSLVVGTAAILKRLGRSDPDTCGHKEYAPGRKIDPDDVSMSSFRGLVEGLMSGKATPSRPGKLLVPFPGADEFVVGKSQGRHVEQLKKWLNAADPKAGTQLAGDKFTEATRKRVAAFQRADERLAGDPDGIPGPITWELLQLAARKAGAK